jgi:sterol desaturase/sphingolipid hydroxylase (fatty acid hydroxylase superfamily)
MESTLLEYEGTVVGCMFWLTLALVATWEAVAPRRTQTSSLRWRWPSNFGVWLASDLMMRWALPVAGVAFALLAAQRGWGLFHRVSLPLWLTVAMSLAAFDLVRYLEHRLYHALPLLWRMHRMHHTDVDCDLTVGIRFHPLESLVSGASALGVIAALGAPPVAVLVDRALVAASTLFAHGNVRIGARGEGLLRLVFVTPETHRIHHSAAAPETDSNFGTLYTWWDRLLGTHVEQPAAGHEGMTIGLERFRERKHSRLDWMLAQPFLR